MSKKRAAEGAKSGSPKKQRVNKKGSAGKGKKPRDSSKPKRPMSAYFFFLEWFRNDLKQKKKDGEDAPTKIGDVAKLAGEKWKTMSNDDKKPFVALHEKARKSYDEQVRSFASHSISAKVGLLRSSTTLLLPCPTLYRK